MADMKARFVAPRGASGAAPENAPAAIASAGFAIDATDHVPVTLERIPSKIEGPWRDKGLDKAPAAHPAPEMDSNGVTAVFLDSVPWKGKPTRFFAFYALPKGASKDKPVPGVVIVHGGGGTAFWKFVKMWNDRGYAAISMDNCGSIPRNQEGKPGGGEFSVNWKGHDWSGPRGWETFADGDLPYQDQWPYHAVATVILSHSFLRSIEGVDPTRIGVSGVSWGGYLTCIAGAVDHCFRWANPIYGCGYLGDHSVWDKKIAKLGATGRRWLDLWDPSVYLPLAKCPYIWVSGQDDFAYPVDSLLKSAALVKDSHYSVSRHLDHGHTPGFLQPAIAEFAAAINAGKPYPVNYPEPFAAIEKLAQEDYAHPVKPIGVDGQEPWNVKSVWFMYPPTFGFTNRADAASYRFEVTDGHGARHGFTSKTANDSLAPVWADLPVGRVSVKCEALGKDGKPLALAGTRVFWKQAQYRDGFYVKPKRTHADAAKMIYNYVLNLPIVKEHYLGDKPVPTEKVNRDNQVLIAYPSKMGAAIIEAMTRLAACDQKTATNALALADGVKRHLCQITEPEGKVLAGFPLTYETHPGLTGHPAKVLKSHGGKVMMVYPYSVAQAYLTLHAVTKEGALKTAALKIADKYLALQGEDGTWPLNCFLKDGKAVEANRLVPVQVMELLERMFALTGEKKYRESADRAFAYVEKGPLATWNWEGQFEDSAPTAKFQNLTKHNACDTAMYLLKRFPNDKRRFAQARELLRFAEDQFVCWEKPCQGVRDDTSGKRKLWGGESWRCPAALEQYNCYVPIDASAAKLARTYLAIYKAEKNPLDLAKARALGDTLVRETGDNGYLPTFWFDFREDWPNCMIASAQALEELAAVK